jgi:hypothetical protein
VRTKLGPEICREDTSSKTWVVGIILKWILQKYGRSYDSIVDIGSRLRDGRSGVRIPTSVRDFSFLPNTQTGSGTHQPPITKVSGVISQT